MLPGNTSKFISACHVYIFGFVQIQGIRKLVPMLNLATPDYTVTVASKHLTASLSVFSDNNVITFHCQPTKA